MKNIQLFDWLKMPHEFGECESTLLIGGVYEGCGNDTYHRWYPDRINKPFGKYEHFKTEQELNAGKKLNQWLLDEGMKIDKFNKYFHVLIHVSW